jgi:hypothetical protein
MRRPIFIFAEIPARMTFAAHAAHAPHAPARMRRMRRVRKILRRRFSVYAEDFEFTSKFDATCARLRRMHSAHAAHAQ